MSKERKYNSLEEVLDATDKKNWNDSRMGEIEDTEENRQIVEDGLFWYGIELVRFTYPRDPLRELMEWIVGIRELWNRRKDGERNDND